MRTWLIGQIHHADAALEALQSPTRSRNGSLPELSLFDCFSCHHNLTEKQWKKRSYGGKPGQLKLNLPALVILQVATTSLATPLGEELATNLRSLHEGYRQGSAQDAINTLKNLINIKIGPSLEKVTVDLSTSTRVLAGLSEFAANNPWPTFELAEQLGMGMQATIASSPELATRYDKDLKEIFGTLKSSEAFKPEAFTAAAQKLSRKMTRSK
jgi:hypothetical protein